MSVYHSVVVRVEVTTLTCGVHVDTMGAPNRSVHAPNCSSEL